MTKLYIYDDAKTLGDVQFFKENVKDFIGRLTYLQSEDDKYMFCVKLGIMKGKPRPSRIVIEENGSDNIVIRFNDRFGITTVSLKAEEYEPFEVI